MKVKHNWKNNQRFSQNFTALKSKAVVERVQDKFQILKTRINELRERLNKLVRNK